MVFLKYYSFLIMKKKTFPVILSLNLNLNYYSIIIINDIMLMYNIKSPILKTNYLITNIIMCL